MIATGLGRGLDRLAKLRASRRLAITRKSDVIEPSQWQRGRTESLIFEQFTGDDQCEQIVQFIAKAGNIHVVGRPRRRAIDLAVDAVEIADLVWIQIHTDADALASTRDDRVDIEVVGETSAGDRGGLARRCVGRLLIASFYALRSAFLPPAGGRAAKRSGFVCARPV